MRFLGINALSRELGVSRLVLDDLIAHGKLGSVPGKDSVPVYSVDMAVRLIEEELSNGTRSLQTHTLGRNGPRPEEMASPEAD